MLRQKLCVIGVLMCGLACLLIYGCGEDDCATCPEQVGNYAFYLYDYNQDGRNLFIYHSASVILDSVFTDCRPQPQLSAQLDTLPYCLAARWGLTVSARGDRLYCSNGDNVAVVSATTLEKLTVLPYPSSHGTSVSPNGQYVAIQDSELNIVNTRDYSLFYHGLTPAVGGSFSADSRTFYYANLDTVFKLGLDRSFAKSARHVPGGRILQVVPSADNSKWFLYVRLYYDNSIFKVYDVRLDSIIFQLPLSPGMGSITASPDRRTLFISNPGTFPVLGMPPPEEFTIFNVASNKVEAVISTAGFLDQNGDSVYYLPIGPMAVSPDGKTLIASQGPYGDVFVVYDVRNKTITKCIRVGNRARILWAACQFKP